MARGDGKLYVAATQWSPPGGAGAQAQGLRKENAPGEQKDRSDGERQRPAA